MTAPDMKAAGRFLTLMAEGEPVTFQTFGERTKAGKLNRVLHGTIEDHGAQLASLNAAGAGIFWMVNYGDGKGRAAGNVTGVRALFVDLDGAPLEPVLSCGLAPHAVVETSPKRWHVYWLTADCALDQFKPLQHALARRFGGDPAVHDLPRVLRLPGFLHVKATPFRTRVVSVEERQPYPVADIVRALGLRSDGPRSTRSAPQPALRGGTFPEGHRNAALAQLAGSMRRKGMGRQAIEAALLAENQARCDPPLPEAEVRTIAASVARYAPAPDGGVRDVERPPAPADTWPDPVLPGAVRTPELPASLLPSWAGAMAEAVAAWSQTPPAMSTLMVLSALAAVLQRRFEVAPYGDEYREPLSLWTLTALPSGSRKTAVINALTEPLVRWEKAERDRLRSELARSYAARAVAEKRIEKLKTDAAKAETAEKRALLQEELQREREAMPPETFAPRLFTGDVTSERLQQLLVEQDERMAVLSDEGGIFSIMAGQYSGGVASLDVFLQGHSGTAMRVDRAGRLAHIDKPALSFGLALQPGVLADVAKAKRFRDSGLLARFLYALPKSNVGQRDVRARNSISADVRDAWGRNILALLADMHRPIGTPVVLPFDAGALEQWLQFAEHVERNQGEGERWEHIADWSGKLPGAAARIAALLELAQRGTAARHVGEDSVVRATKLCALLAVHAEAAFRLMGAADAEGDALALLRWIESNRFHTFTRHEAHRAMEGRFRTVERLIGAVRALQDWQVLGPERKRNNERARPTHFYDVNPKLFVGSSGKSPEAK